MLSDNHVLDVCMVYRGASQCRYLEGDPQNYKKFYCRKQTPDKSILDECVNDHIKECVKNGIDPMSGGQAIGDNCQGYVCFKHKIQGYDVED